MKAHNIIKIIKNNITKNKLFQTNCHLRENQKQTNKKKKDIRTKHKVIAIVCLKCGMQMII